MEASKFSNMASKLRGETATGPVAPSFGVTKTSGVPEAARLTWPENAVVLPSRMVRLICSVGAAGAAGRDHKILSFACGA